jgi:hypothetical protein
MQTDSELLEAFRRMHPTYTAKTLQSVLCIGRRMAFLLLKGYKLEEYQKRLLRLYLELPAECRERYFS